MPTKSKYYINFRCSYLIFLSSVANLPYSTKTEIEYKSIRNYTDLSQVPELEIDYVKQDVLTVKRNLYELTTNHNVKLTGKFKTIGGIAYREMKKTTNEQLAEKGLWWELLFPPLPFDLDTEMRPAYNGGWSYLNPKYAGVLIEELVGSWDQVSGYPAVWRDKPLPCGYPTIQKHKPKDKLFIVKLTVYNAKIKEGHHPFIATSKAMRYMSKQIYPTELNEVVISLTSIDYAMFEKYYEGYWEPEQYIVFNRTVKGVFANYIDKWFNVKDMNKQIKKTAKGMELQTALFKEMWAKLHINSPYGKFGTNPTIRSVKPVFIDGLLRWEKVEEQKEENNFYLPLACFITAYVREKTITLAQDNKERYIYADTDSNHYMGTELPNNIDLGTELGQWDYEGTSYKSKFMCPKRYLKVKKDNEGKEYISRAIAGLSRSEHERVNFDNFEIGIQILAGKKQAQNVKGGRIIKELDFTFR